MAQSLLNEVVKEVKKRLPQFNRELILELRQKSIMSLEQFVDQFMRNIAEHHIEEIEYDGYHEVGPKQLVEHLTNEKNKYYKPDITNNTLRLMEYKFLLHEDGQIVNFSLFYYLPYLKNQAIELSGLNYYPIFTIGNVFMVRKKNKDGFQYEGLAFPFHIYYVQFIIRKKDIYEFISVNSGKSYTATVIKIDAHHNVKDKYAMLPPMILYLFAKFGFYPTISMFEFEKDEIELVELIDGNDKLHEYFEITNSPIFVKVKKSSLVYHDKRRFVAGLVMILRSFPVNDINTIFNDEMGYFKLNLGRWIQGPNVGPVQQKNQALEHLRTMDKMVDIFSKADLKLDGIEVDDIYQLIHYLFYNIFSLVHYKPNVMFNKRINLLPYFLFDFISSLNREVLSKDRLLKRPMKKKTFRTIFTKQEHLLVRHIKSLPHVFMSVNDLSNGNWLLSVGARKYKYTKDKYVNPKDKKQKKSKGNALRLNPIIYAHPSQLFVESILNFPSGNPCIGGTLNIFNKDIDISTGMIRKPEGYEKHENIYESS